MPLHALTLTTPEALVEPVTDALMDALGALATSVEDADAGTDGERPLFGEPGLPPPAMGWARSVVTALFADAAAAEQAAALLLAQDWTQGLAVQGLAEVPDDDWVRKTQAQFQPVPITPTFWVVPSWHAVPPEAQQVIRLDPGLAFGTGTHPTTAMCLHWIAEQAEAGQGGWARALDYGCGSGILAIAAKLHGAAEVDAVDIDPAAVESTQANAAANGVVLRTGLPDAAQGQYPLVLANILATPLKLLAPLLAAHVAPGGHLLLAGLLARQVSELQAAYAPWLALREAAQVDGWSLLVGRRAA